MDKEQQTKQPPQIQIDEESKSIASAADQSQRGLNQSRQSINNSNYAPSSKASEGSNRSKVSKRSRQTAGN